MLTSVGSKVGLDDLLLSSNQIILWFWESFSGVIALFKSQMFHESVPPLPGYTFSLIPFPWVCVICYSWDRIPVCESLIQLYRIIHVFLHQKPYQNSESLLWIHVSSLNWSYISCMIPQPANSIYRWNSHTRINSHILNALQIPVISVFFYQINDRFCFFDKTIMSLEWPVGFNDWQRKLHLKDLVALQV